jgi:hypothetical protein
MATIRWSGLGILALPVMIAGPCAGCGGAVSLFGEVANPDGGDVERLGVPLGGGAVGFILAGGLVYLLGVAMNRRRAPDGSWHSTERHTYGGVPVETAGVALAIGGVALLPLATTGFVPGGVEWWLLGGWVLLLIVAGIVIATRRDRRLHPRPATSAATPPAGMVVHTDQDHDDGLDQAPFETIALSVAGILDGIATLQWNFTGIARLDTTLDRIGKALKSRDGAALRVEARALRTLLPVQERAGSSHPAFPSRRVKTIVAKLRAAAGPTP